MDLKPKTENGKVLMTLLKKWLDSSEGKVLDKLKRVLYLYSSKITKQDSFLSALYGQNVLNEPPSPDLIENLFTVVSRVQQAVEISLNKGCLKEIVVALEWNENGDILTEILKWAQEMEAQQANELINSIDLAPQRAGRTLKSLFARSLPEIPKPREREISWAGEKKIVTALEVCEKKIIVGWNSGQIKIFDVLNLDCIVGFQHFGSVTCFQCTCKELISGHSDGSICVWNIDTGLLTQKFMFDSCSSSCPEAMRWKRPRLLVAGRGTLKMWQYVDSSFIPLGGQSCCYHSAYKTRLEFDENHAVCLSGQNLSVHYLNGIVARDLKLSSATGDFALQNDHLIVSRLLDKVVYILDIMTGACLKELRGHVDGVISVDTNNGFVVSGDKRGEIMLWDLTSALDRNADAGITITRAPTFSYHPQYFSLRLGRSFIVKSDSHSHRIVVIDFPN